MDWGTIWDRFNGLRHNLRQISWTEELFETDFSTETLFETDFSWTEELFETDFSWTETLFETDFMDWGIIWDRFNGLSHYLRQISWTEELFETDFFDWEIIWDRFLMNWDTIWDRFYCPRYYLCCKVFFFG